MTLEQEERIIKLLKIIAKQQHEIMDWSRSHNITKNRDIDEI